MSHDIERFRFLRFPETKKQPGWSLNYADHKTVNLSQSAWKRPVWPLTEIF